VSGGRRPGGSRAGGGSPAPAVAARQLDGEGLEAGHEGGEARERGLARAAHAHQHGVAARLAQHARNARDVLNGVHEEDCGGGGQVGVKGGDELCELRADSGWVWHWRAVHEVCAHVCSPGPRVEKRGRLLGWLGASSNQR